MTLEATDALICRLLANAEEEMAARPTPPMRHARGQIVFGPLHAFDCQGFYRSGCPFASACRFSHGLDYSGTDQYVHPALMAQVFGSATSSAATVVRTAGPTKRKHAAIVSSSAASAPSVHESVLPRASTHNGSAFSPECSHETSSCNCNLHAAGVLQTLSASDTLGTARRCLESHLLPEMCDLIQAFLPSATSFQFVSFRRHENSYSLTLCSILFLEWELHLQELRRTLDRAKMEEAEREQEARVSTHMFTVVVYSRVNDCFALNDFDPSLPSPFHMHRDSSLPLARTGRKVRKTLDASRPTEEVANVAPPTRQLAPDVLVFSQWPIRVIPAEANLHTVQDDQYRRAHDDPLRLAFRTRGWPHAAEKRCFGTPSASGRTPHL